MGDKRGHAGPLGTHSPHEHSPQCQVPAGSPSPAVGRARAACREAAGGKRGKGFGVSLGLGSPGDGAMWDWGAPRTEGAQRIGDALWDAPGNERDCVGIQRYPWELRVSGDGGALRMSPRTGGALVPHHLPPQLSAITATMRSTEPSTARWISTGRAVPPAALWGHSVGSCWQALHLPARPISQSPSPTYGPNLAPAPLNPPSPNLSNDPNSMPSRFLFLSLGP